MNRIWVATCIINAGLVWKNMCYEYKHSYIYIYMTSCRFNKLDILKMKLMHAACGNDVVIFANISRHRATASFKAVPWFQVWRHTLTSQDLAFLESDKQSSRNTNRKNSSWIGLQTSLYFVCWDILALATCTGLLWKTSLIFNSNIYTLGSKLVTSLQPPLTTTHTENNLAASFRCRKGRDRVCKNH